MKVFRNQKLWIENPDIIIKLIIISILISLISLLYCYIPSLSPLLDKVGISLIGRGILAFILKIGAPGGIAFLVAVGSFFVISESCYCYTVAGSGSGEGAGGTEDLSAGVVFKGQGSGTSGQPPGPSGDLPSIGSNSGALSPSWSVGPPASADSGGSYSSWIADLQGQQAEGEEQRVEWPANIHQGDHPPLSVEEQLGPSSSNPPAPLSVEEEEQHLLEETDRRIREETDRRILDLKNDPFPTTVAYRNALIKQEEIVGVMTQILNQRGVSVTDPGDIRKGVDIFLTDVMDEYGDERRKDLNRILVDLVEKRDEGVYYELIFEEIDDLDDPCGKKKRR